MLNLMVENVRLYKGRNLSRKAIIFYRVMEFLDVSVDTYYSVIGTL
jgi:hypothetical protein